MRPCTASTRISPQPHPTSRSSADWLRTSTTTWTRLSRRPLRFSTAWKARGGRMHQWRPFSMHPDATPVSRPLPLAPMEVWGGVEPTVNRVQGRYSDQSIRTGHHDRLTDLELIASLGVQAVRYPVLWERTAPSGIAQADWTWADERLNGL